MASVSLKQPLTAFTTEVLKVDALAPSLLSDPVSEARPAVFTSALQEFMVVLICSFSVAASSISSGAYQISLEHTGRHFNINGGLLTWAVGSNSLAVGAFILIAGGVADAFGRKNSLLVSITLYSILNLITGFMQSFILLCVFRALVGVVVAAATPSAAGIIGSSYTPSKRKNRALACFSAGAPLGYIVGLVVGGIATQYLSWRACHYFLAIVYILFTPLIYVYIPQDLVLDRKTVLTKLRSLDYLGAFLMVCGFTLIVFALTQVDVTTQRWRTPYIIACLVVGVVVLGTFVAYEIYVPQDPLLVVALWTNRNFVLAVVAMGLCWIDFNSVLTYYATIYFQYVKGYSPLHTTAVAMPMGVVGVTVNVFAGLTMHLISGRVLMVVSTLAFLAAAVIWATTEMSRNYWAGPFLCYSLSVIGADLAYNVVNMVALSSVDKSLQSRAAGTFNTFIQLAASIGFGVSSAIVSATYPSFGTPEGYANKKGLFVSLRGAYWFGAGCAGVAFVLSIFLKVKVSGDADDATRGLALQKQANRELSVCVAELKTDTAGTGLVGHEKSVEVSMA